MKGEEGRSRVAPESSQYKNNIILNALVTRTHALSRYLPAAKAECERQRNEE